MNGRYQRQQLLPEIGEAGQQKLREASVLIVGAGGLGSPLALYLAGAGVGRIGIVDDDTVSVTNLQRQVLYTESQVGGSKALHARERLLGLNSDICVEAYPLRLTETNAAELIARYDIVADGCDNFATRYLVNDVCMQLGKPYVYGAITELDGQVSVFNYPPGAGATYRDLYPSEEAMRQLPPPPKGVVGVTPGIVGCVEANEVLKLICGYGELLARRLWTIDLRTLESHIFSIG
ncbi:MAG: HesA/MoeB/ThiF family protein [Parabacteroides sp.]|nr:HesA/MoeB/ThiF family protein [Parabacteroides sp.]